MEKNSSPLPIEQNLGARLSAASNQMQRVVDAVGTLFIGQPEVLKLTVACVFARGHLLLEGPPGTGKTFLINTLADVLGLKFGRIQCTPDLMPGDITGSLVRDEETGKLRFEEGPIFVNMVLLDEINRAGPKVQSATLEAMQEKQVTNNGKTLRLPQPFFVAATQNPSEHEGTYPLPEAQKDRFMLCVALDYPDKETEIKIGRAKQSGAPERLEPIMDAERVMAIMDLVDEVQMGADLEALCADVVRGMRKENNADVSYEPGTRAITSIMRAAKSLALLEGRTRVDKSDVGRVVLPALQHRVVMKYAQDDSALRKSIDTVKQQLRLEVAPQPRLN